MSSLAASVRILDKQNRVGFAKTWCLTIGIVSLLSRSISSADTSGCSINNPPSSGYFFTLTKANTMMSDVDYYCGWLVFIVLMVLGFIAGG